MNVTQKNRVVSSAESTAALPCTMSSTVHVASTSAAPVQTLPYTQSNLLNSHAAVPYEAQPTAAATATMSAPQLAGSHAGVVPAGLPAPGVVPSSAEMTEMLRRMQQDPQFANEVMTRAAQDHDFAMVCMREMSSNPEYMGLAMQLLQNNPQVMAQAQSLMMNDPTGTMQRFASPNQAMNQMGATLGAPRGGTQTPMERYAAGVQQLVSMGFTDEAASLAALQRSGGDISQAINFLTGST